MDPTATVSVQIKSHKKIVEEDTFYDKVLSQRTQSDAYGADLYLIFLYGNTRSTTTPKRGRGTREQGQIVCERAAELRRKIGRTNHQRNTEAVTPESLAQAIARLGLGDALAVG